MLDRRFVTLVSFALSAILPALLVGALSGQAKPPLPQASVSSTHAATDEHTATPRPPTRQDVAQLKAAMYSPGSVLEWVAIVGNFAYAGVILAPTGNTASGMLATNTSGKWVYIDDDPGSFSAEDMVDIVPSMPLPVARALLEQALRDQVYWTAKARGPAWDKKVQTYFDYNTQGYEAGNRGDFDTAIAAWTKAAAMDFGDLRSCGDGEQRFDIRIGNEAKTRMNELHLAKAEAASWFQQRSQELQKAHKVCDLP